MVLKMFQREELQVVQDLPIAAQGMWKANPKPIAFSATDLQQMASNLNAGIPPIVPQSFGHNTDPMFIGRMMDAYGIKNSTPFVGDMEGRGAMSLGYLTNARVIAGEVVVDIKDVPKTLAGLMTASGVGYNTTSPLVLRKEFVDQYFGPNCGIVGPVLLGLALLGAEQPAYITQAGMIGLSFDMMGEAGITALSAYPGEPSVEEPTEPTAEGQALAGSTHVDGANNNQEDSEMPDETTNANETGTGFKAAEADGQFNLQNLETGPSKGMGVALTAFMENMTAQMNSQTENIQKLTDRMDGMVHETFTSQLSGHAAKWAFMDDATRTVEVARITELHGQNPEGAVAAMDAYDRVANMTLANNAGKPPPHPGARGGTGGLMNQRLWNRESLGIDPNAGPETNPMNQMEMNEAILKFAVDKGMDPVLDYDKAVDGWTQLSPNNADMFEFLQANGDTVVTGEFTVIPN